MTRSGNEAREYKVSEKSLNFEDPKGGRGLVIFSQMIYLTVVRLAESSVSEVTGEQGRDTLDSPELSSVPPGGFSVSDWEVSLD